MPNKKIRFHALDLLRGFFIVVIIIDHLSRWPSLFVVFTGQALMWVTAAEGFVIISGLLVGYIRGYKAKAQSLRGIAFKLWRRALTLYLWAILGTILYTAALWYIPLIGGAPGLPIEKGDWASVIFQSITLDYTLLWVYFLKLYAIFLALSPLALWLMRANKAWLAALASFGALVLGWYTEDQVLQWQALFFIPMIAGYYLPAIQNWWQGMSKVLRKSLTAGIILVTAATITVSYIGIYQPLAAPALDAISKTLFDKESMGIMRLLMAFTWFTAYALVFIKFEKYIQRAFGWLLLPIGTHSLTAYIVHGAIIVLISYFTVDENNIVANTLLGFAAVIGVWFIVKIPGINRLIPR